LSSLLILATPVMLSRPVEAGNKTNWIEAYLKDDRYCRRCSLGRERCWYAARRGDDRHLTAHQFSSQRGQSIELILRPAIFDRDVLTFDVAGFVQASIKRGHAVAAGFERATVQEPDSRHRGLLCARRERPRGRAADEHDERAALHSITSSARASKVGGISRPSAFAVLRLMTSSYLVGACTGKSAGFSPLRMRSM